MMQPCETTFVQPIERSSTPTSASGDAVEAKDVVVMAPGTQER